MPTIETSADFDVYCDECGALLDADTNRQNNVKVTPCPTCIESAVKDALATLPEEDR